jgi:hypothetical protein
MRLSPPNFLRSNAREHHLVPSAIHRHHLQEKPIHLWLPSNLRRLLRVRGSIVDFQPFERRRLRRIEPEFPGLLQFSSYSRSSVRYQFDKHQIVILWSLPSLKTAPSMPCNMERPKNIALRARSERSLTTQSGPTNCCRRCSFGTSSSYIYNVFTIHRDRHHRRHRCYVFSPSKAETPSSPGPG